MARSWRVVDTIFSLCLVNTGPRDSFLHQVLKLQVLKIGTAGLIDVKIRHFNTALDYLWNVPFRISRQVCFFNEIFHKHASSSLLCPPYPELVLKFVRPKAKIIHGHFCLSLKMWGPECCQRFCGRIFLNGVRCSRSSWNWEVQGSSGPGPKATPLWEIAWSYWLRLQFYA